MRILVPAALAASVAAVLPVMPASAAHCGCRTVHRASYGYSHHAVRRVAYVRPVVRRVVYRPRIVEVVRPVYRPVVYRPLYRPVHRVYVEPMWRPRPVFYHARFAPRPWHHRWEERRMGWGGGARYGGFRERGGRDGGWRDHGGGGYGGGFHHRGDGWR